MAIRSARDTSAENGAKSTRSPYAHCTPSTRITTPPLRPPDAKRSAIAFSSRPTAATRSMRFSSVRRLLACLVRVPAMNFWMNASVRAMCACCCS